MAAPSVISEKGFLAQVTFDKFVPGPKAKACDGIIRRVIASTSKQQKGEIVRGFRFRTADQLNINFLWLYLTSPKAHKGILIEFGLMMWVVATEYIGPLRQE